MALIEDDTDLRPEIDPNVLFFISNLDDAPEVYTRFFDALLITRNQHRAFYRDLKAFREQPQVISILQKASTDKTQYKEATRVFLESRFAHPWCRKTPLKKGFWRSEWGNIEGKPKDQEIAREEDNLHKLLVPIWVCMKVRMFPGDDVVESWCRENEHKKRRVTVADIGEADNNAGSGRTPVPPKGLKKMTSCPDLYDEDDDDDEAEERGRIQAGNAATTLFRLAAAGAILSQTPKRKLRWLTKKPK